MINYIYIDGSGHKKARPVSNREEYVEQRNAPENVENFRQARAGDAQAKTRLVQYNYNDLLPDGVLKGCCHAASTFAHDIDCGDEQACKAIAGKLLAMKDAVGLLELSVSSGWGLHAVCRRQPGRTILECQVRLSRLTQTEMDTSAHDEQRVLFTGPADAETLLYLDDDIFHEPMTVEESAEEYRRLKERERLGLEDVPEGAKKANKHFVAKPDATHEERAAEGSAAQKAPSGELCFKNIPYSAIIHEYWQRTGGEPQTGERNVKLHKLAVHLRAICDNKKEVLMAVMPRLGLSEQELRSIVDSACKEEPKGVSKMLQQILSDAAPSSSPEGDTTDEELQDNSSPLGGLKGGLRTLPIGLKESLKGVSEQMQMPVLCAVLPLAAAYADQVVVEYCDGQRQHLGLMSLVIGEQAAGKSVCKNVVDIWKLQMDEQDEVARDVEERWKEKKKGRKSTERAPEDPKVVIRNLPITVSCTTLLKRLKNSQGHTLYSFDEELDTVVKTNLAGSWSKKEDVYRKSFDRGEWGQDYNSDMAESGTAKVAYNWTALGTYGSLNRLFKADNIENGLSSRMLIAEMPNTAFAKLPKNTPRTEADEKKIQEAVTRLCESGGFVNTPRLRKAIERWVEAKRVEALKADDHVMDIFRRRAAVIGFRCGVVFFLLSGNKIETKNCVDFALMMAEYCLKGQMRLFGERLRKRLRENSLANTASPNMVLFELLPSVFSYDDVMRLKGEDASHANIRKIISRWKLADLISKNGQGTWSKKL